MNAKIEVLGSGCRKCKALFDLTTKVVKELGVEDPVIYSTDISRMVALGAMSSPVLAIDGRIILAGSLPDEDKLKAIISNILS